MKSINRLELLGNLGNDPDLQMLGSGRNVCNISIATSESYKDQNGNWQEKTSWHRVTFFDKLAETINQYCRKGSKVYLEAKLSYGKYEKDGVTHYTTNIVGKSIIFLDKKEKADKTQQTMQAEDQPVSERERYMNQQTNDDDDDVDVPF